MTRNMSFRDFPKLIGMENASFWHGSAETRKKESAFASATSDLDDCFLEELVEGVWNCLMYL